MLDPLTTRRVFLQQGLGLLAVGATAPAFIDRTAMAIDRPLDAKRIQAPSGKDDNILVVVQLSGGNDGLNMVVPYADDRYHRARPAIRHDAKAVLKLDDYAGLHPALGPLKNLYDAGRLSIVQGVGYPNPNRSHFRSMDVWHSANPDDAHITSGWLGRYFDHACAGADPKHPGVRTPVDPHAGVWIGGQLPLAMRGEFVTPLAFERPEAFRYAGPDLPHFLALNRPGAPPPPPEAFSSAPPSAAAQLDFLHRTAMDAQVSSDDILRMTRAHAPAVAYPGKDFAQGLKTVAALIAGGLATRVYYVSLTGFDTHAGERGRHDALMAELADALAAFWKDLEAQRNAPRVLVMTFSEFGRRVEQNASGGTDHGAAAPMFLLGHSLRGGLVGRHPSLADLDQGDLKFATDFRGVYAAVLQDWLHAPPAAVLGRSFPLAPIFKT